MLVAVLMYFLVFSFTGVAVLNISYVSNTTSMETKDNVQLQYTLESAVNEALWLINAGEDSLVNRNTQGVASYWNAERQILTVNVEKNGLESEVMLDLSEDDHFKHGLAASEGLYTNNYETDLIEDREPRSGFRFLPEVYLQYYYDHAVSISNKPKKPKKNQDGSVLENGIHIFTGNNITIEDLVLESGTLVFTGFNIRFLGTNIIHAPAADSTGAQPALIFTDPRQNFEMYSENAAETIIGTIYCQGDVELHNGNLSGPVLARNITLGNNLYFLDGENPGYYQWNRGFGNRADYDWPKAVSRWQTTKWGRIDNNS